MPRAARYTLTTTPTKVNVAVDDSIAFRSLIAVAQAAGTVVVCDDAASFATGARFTLAAGGALTFSNLENGEHIWLAASTGTLAVDVLETGVA